MGLGAMERFKISQERKKGKKAAKIALNAALERKAAVVHAMELAAEQRKKKDGV